MSEVLLILHEGKTFWHYNDRWESRPQYLIALSHTLKQNSWHSSPSYYRIALRKIASSTNERTLIISLLPCLWLSSDSVFAEQNANNRSNSSVLEFVAYCSSFSSDWVTRQLVSSNVNLFIVNRVALPNTRNISTRTFLSHSSLRLTCNHSGYDSLWREQLGTEWREPNREAFTYPVLETEDQRWQIRAAIDAVVAAAYGLTRAQYAHVLSTFSHKSYLQAPHLCLNYFDELQAIGLETFTRKYDPYWDIPLNENLPQPVIDLPIPITPPQDSELFDTSQHINEVKPQKRKSKK